MLDSILRRNNFKSKCKTAVTRTRTRLEAIKRKRNAMQKFLKKDIADLIKANLPRVAYTRAEGLCIELNLSICYEYLEECCKFVAIHLKELNDQRECPEECKVVVSSLIYGAARFADLPELRDLRNQFNEKYSDSLGPYVNKEFVENLKSKVPTREMKLQVMQKVAKEFAITWDPSALELQPQKPNVERGVRHNVLRSKSMVVEKGKDKKVDDDYDDENIGTKLLHKHSCSMIVHARLEPISTQTRTQSDSDSEKDRTPKSVRTKYLRQSVSSSSCSSDNEFGLKDTWTAMAPTNEEETHIVLPLPPVRRRYFSESQPTSPYNKSDGDTENNGCS